MRIALSLILIFMLPVCQSFAQKTDRKLETTLKELVKDFRGEIGVYVYHSKRNTAAAIQADTVFPTASIVKVPILVGIFHKINEGELKLSDRFTYRAERTYGGSGLMQFYKDSAQTDLATMVSLMLTYSDNVTSIWCQELSGGGEAINQLMDQLGLFNTKVNSRTKGREDIWKKYGWGQTTPREMVQLMRLIRQGAVFNPRLSDKMYRFLKNQFYNGRSLSQIPAHIATASKTGSINEARGEVVVVHAPSGDYMFSVLTKNNKDQSWTDQNEAEVLTRKISHILWKYFEPGHPFEPYEPVL